ncbi:MAG TPA: MmgE/PrpD family protein [Usitatibacter sp.]|jgi:2-methylcitrate dehydratase PrpD|nr:MmgE/PrpD family protein [Usitatibacter sp.]
MQATPEVVEAKDDRGHPLPLVTDYVACFVAGTQWSDIPEDVRHLGKRSVIDGIGLALAGAASECGHIAHKYLEQLGIAQADGCTVIGSRLRMPARFAAFANGLAIHADDYDDTQLAVTKDRVYGLLTHPTAPALPPVLALAERARRSGRDLMLAYQLGVEVECKVAEAINPRHYQQGFHSTATCGSIGAAAGAAKLLGLDVEATRRAVSIGATQAGGLRENFGTMTKPFHAGRAAENGVVAAEIAKLGFTASPNGLEAERGFFRAAGGGFDANLIMGELGDPWTFRFPGVSIKPHPSGSLTHPGMAVMLELIRKNNIQPGQVKHVLVGTNHNMPNALIHHEPGNELQAKFSMEFCMAILLIERKAGLEQFTDEVVNRADVQEMIKRVDFRVHPEAEAAGFDKMTTIVEVTLNDGRAIKGRADFGRGSPANPMSDEELSGKFRGCAQWGGLDRARTDQLLDMLWQIEKVGDVNTLTTLLRRE